MATHDPRPYCLTHQTTPMQTLPVLIVGRVAFLCTEPHPDKPRLKCEVRGESAGMKPTQPAVEVAREIREECDWGPGDHGYCCLRHEEIAVKLLDLIVSMFPMVKR